MLPSDRHLFPAELGITRKERRHVSRLAMGRWMARPRSVFIMIGLGAILFAVVYFTSSHSQGIGGLIPPWLDAVLSLILIWIFFFVLYFAADRTGYRGLIYAELRDRGYDICTKCGYFRVGIKNGASCPECGMMAGPSRSGF